VKRTISVFVIYVGVALVCGFGATVAQASFFGQVTTARILERGVQDVSAFVGFYEDATMFFGQLRRGFSSSVEGGLQFGLLDPEVGDVGLAAGGDFKFGLMASKPGQPLDMAFDIRGAYFNLDVFSVVELGASAILSHPYVLTQGSTLTPYGAVNLRVEHVSIDNQPNAAARRYTPARALANGGGDDTSLEISAMGGVKWDISDLLDLLGEIVIDDQLGLIFGINFKI